MNVDIKKVVSKVIDATKKNEIVWSHNNANKVTITFTSNIHITKNKELNFQVVEYINEVKRSYFTLYFVPENKSRTLIYQTMCSRCENIIDLINILKDKYLLNEI